MPLFTVVWAPSERGVMGRSSGSEDSETFGVRNVLGNYSNVLRGLGNFSNVLWGSLGLAGDRGALYKYSLFYWGSSIIA